jgi:hypothetical protein
MAYQPLADAAPDLAILPQSDSDIEEVPMGLVFIDKEDEETHIYPLTPEVRAELMEMMGGPPRLVVPEGL